MERKKPKFLRIGYTQYSKLGLRRKNKQVYRRAKGIDNKMRLKMKGHLRNISIGYKSERKTRDLVLGLKPILVHNLEELKLVKKDEICVLGKIGMKKRIEIANYAIKNNIKIANLNSKKYLGKVEEKLKEKSEEHKRIEDKLKEREKRAKEAEKKTAENKNEKKEKTETKIEEKDQEKK